MRMNNGVKITTKQMIFPTIFLIFLFFISGCTTSSSVSTVTSDNKSIDGEKILQTFVVDNDSATDKILIYEPTKQVKPTIIINTKITPDMGTTFDLIGDKLFFYDKQDRMIEWISFNGEVHKITATKGNYEEDPVFIVSEKNNKISWVSIEYGEKIKSTIYISDLDGKDKKELYTQTDQSKIIKPIKWSDSGDTIFWGEALDGLGGLVVYRNYEDILKTNVDTGATKSIVGEIKPKRNELDNTDYISDLSPDEEMISYFNKIDGHFKLFVRNIDTLKEDAYNIPDDSGYLAAGNAYFSSDNKYLSYEIAYQDPKHSLASGEYITKYVVNDLNQKTNKVYDDSGFPYIIIDRRWLDKNSPTLIDALADMKLYEKN